MPYEAVKPDTPLCANSQEHLKSVTLEQPRYQRVSCQLILELPGTRKLP